MPTGKISKMPKKYPIPPPKAERQVLQSWDLKPCPFDGGKAEVEHYASRKFPWKVECIRCWISTPGYRHAELAVEAWNRRV